MSPTGRPGNRQDAGRWTPPTTGRIAKRGPIAIFRAVASKGAFPRRRPRPLRPLPDRRRRNKSGGAGLVSSVWHDTAPSPLEVTPLSDMPPAIICIPVRDEEAALPALLAALGKLDGNARPDLCFYLDGCTDRSESVLRAAGRDRLHIVAGPRAAEPNAGRARRAALAIAMALPQAADALLFTTDADSLPAPDWIAAGAAALRVADVVAGLIVREDGAADRGQSRIERYYDRLHACRRRLDPVPWEAATTHHFSGGANIAIRAACYRALGGFRPLPSAEDATLLDDAARAGFRVRRDAALVVATSSRRDGRALEGLAGSLRALDGGEVQYVAHPHDLAWQAAAQAHARRAFATIDDTACRAGLGTGLGLGADHILGVARDCPNAEAFAMRVVPAPPTRRDPVPLAVAEAILADLEAQWRMVAA